jgi:TonB family protein
LAIGMAGQVIRIVSLAGMVTAAVAAQGTVGVIRSQPLPSPQDIAELESRVLDNPDDLDAEGQLLQFYARTALPSGHDDPGRAAVRLQHILYLVQHHPEAAVSGSRAAYIYGANRPYANAADHEAVREAWLDAVQAHPKDNAVTLNAVRFLAVEDADDAEQVLGRAMEAEPENREIAANLGFLYAMELLGLDSLSRDAKPTIIGREQPNRALAALEQSSNAVVLAAAGTALPNLSKSIGSVDAINQTMFDLANELSTQARQLAPDDHDIQGPMPLIQYFVAAQEAAGTGFSAPQTAASAPSRIRVGENVQAANLIQKTQPEYPEEARKAGITGEVRFTVVIGKDGTTQNVQLISGHPLLVDAAMQAVEKWLYKPTLLNGSPVEVVTTITVSFPPN